MAITVVMEWPGVTQEHYEAVMQELDLDQNPPDGALFHVASFASNSLEVLDVWESTEEFAAFSAARRVSR